MLLGTLLRENMVQAVFHHHWPLIAQLMNMGFNNGINRARLFTETAINALEEINIVPGSPS